MAACKRVLSHPPPNALSALFHVCHWATPRTHLPAPSQALISPQLTKCGSDQWPACYWVQFNIPLNCSGLSTKCEAALIHPPPSPAEESHALKKGETHTEECVKPRFQSSQTFSVWSVCWPAPLMQLRAKTSHQRMCQSLGIPMPKFPISTVPSSHGSSESGDLVLHLNNCLYNCQHHRHYHHCLQHHDDNGTVIASIVIVINQCQVPTNGQSVGRRWRVSPREKLSLCANFVLVQLDMMWFGTVWKGLV